MKQIPGLVLLALLLFAPIRIQAQETLVVRSGEHKTFSRLVFDFGKTTTWDLRLRAAGYDLTIEQSDDLIDLTRIYKFIPRTRLISITESENADGMFRLELAANHHVEAFEVTPGKLVVDIKEGAPEVLGQNSTRENETTNVVRAEAAPPTVENSTDTPPPDPPQIYVLQPPSHSSGISPGKRSTSFLNVKTALKADLENPQPPVLNVPDVRVTDARKRLVEQLNRAIKQGVVEPGSQNSIGPVTDPELGVTDTRHRPEQATLTSDPQERVKATSLPQVVSEAARGNYLDHLNLGAQTVHDRDRPKGSRGTTASDAGQACIPDGDLDLENWQNEDVVHAEIATLYREMLGEFDKPISPILERLVKLYIVLGFGTEARALLNTYVGQVKNEALLIELSHLIETGAAQNDSVLASQAQCSGRSAMWSILARPAIPLGEEPDGDIITHHFAVLPADLRRKIGPLLGTRLLDAGFAHEANEIAKLIARAPGSRGSGYLLLVAGIDLKRGHSASANKTLLGLIESGQENAAEALIMLANSHLESLEPLSEDLIENIASRAFELRNSALGQDLRRVEILSWAVRQQQTRAFDILTHEAVLATLDPHEANKIANQVFLSFDLATLQTNELVQAYFRYRYLLTDDPEMDRARRHVARGLFQAGLTDTVLDVLTPLLERKTSRDRLLLGKVYLRRGQPKMTLRLIEQIDSDEAKILRAKAYAKLGNYSQAIEIGGEILPSEEVDDFAWRAGRWDIVSDSDRPSRRQAATYVQKDESGSNMDSTSVPTATGTETGTPTDLSIAGLGELLTESKNIRENNKLLLQDHPKP